MYLSEQDAVTIYARACRSWYGSKASRVVRTKITQLQRAGDIGGVTARRQVDAELRKLPKTRTLRAQLGKLY